MKVFVFNVLVVVVVLAVSMFGTGDLPRLALPLVYIQVAVNTYYIVEKLKS